MDRPFSRYSNSASAPLPLIPRKPRPLKPTSENTQPWTHRDDSDTSSSSTSDASRPTIYPRVKPQRTQRITSVRPPELFDHESPRRRSRLSPTPPRVITTPPEGTVTDPSPLEETPLQLPLALQTLVRKKSGEPVKSSLKSSKPHPRGSLSVVTRGLASKSMPNTPTQTKAVHFDAHLDVKLFLAEQRPLAVSRDASPTDDTSGTDSDFPSFIYGDAFDEKKLVMQVTNMPPMVDPYANVALEQITLNHDATAILGNARVRNMAYQKFLAVRFTFDSWQTTSEVGARYIKSLNSDFDRFAFTIRLNDLLARIEDKTLILALRYSVNGMEFWDNNHAFNYVLTFTRPKSRQRVRAKSEGADDLTPSYLTRRATEHDHFNSFASRYDISSSLNSWWRSPDAGDSLGTGKPAASPSGDPAETLVPFPSSVTHPDTDAKLASRETSPERPPSDHITPPSSIAEYTQFLTKFCFYTGSTDFLTPDYVPRSQSVSNVESFLSTSSSPPLSSGSTSTSTPTRASSFDSRSGSATPAAMAFISA